jgi:hypothetical protein
MLWEFARFFVPDNPAALGINASEAVALHGPLRADRLRQAVADVAARHDALRMVFHTIEDDPSIRFLPEVMPVLSIVDLSDTPEGVRDRRLRQLVESGHDRPFDVAREPLWEVLLVRLSPEHHVLSISACHLIADGLSAQLLLRDLGAAYSARLGESDIPPPVTQFSEVMEDARLTAERERQATGYWRDRLRPLPSVPVFEAADRSAQVDPGIEVRRRFDFAPGLVGGLTAFASANRTTPFVVLLSAYRTLLWL